MKHYAIKNSAQRLNTSESERLYSLKEYGILDTPPEESFDIIAEIALKISECPVAAITFLDDERLWFKSILGLDEQTLPREQSACNLTIKKPEVYQVEDMAKHPLLSEHPWIKNHYGMRFYAGVPLINKEGFALGTLCVFDKKPRKLSPDKLHFLSLLARDIIQRLEERRKALIRDESILSRSERLIAAHIKLLKQNERLEKIQSKLDKQTGLLQSILKNSPHHISLIDEQGRYRLINEAAAVHLKSSVEEIIGKKYTEVQHSSNLVKRHLKVMEEVLRTAKASEIFEDEIIAEEGSLHFQTIMIPVEREKAKKMVMQISTNTTEMRNMQLSLNQKNEELEKLIYSLSHDLRGPISSILGLLNVEKYASIEDMRKYFNLIRTQAMKMDSSIHDLVELKNVTNKNVTPAIVNVDFVLNEMIKAYKDRKVTIKTEGAKGVSLRTDLFFLQSAIDRVLANAVYFHPKGAESPMVNITVKEQKDVLHIIVSDNGVGISAQTMPRIFEMFYRGNTLSQGHGLGLYIANSALERIKASITVESTENVGTKVTMRIPNVEGIAYF